jgi:hypothetical protein
MNDWKEYGESCHDQPYPEKLNKLAKMSIKTRGTMQNFYWRSGYY